MSGHNKWSKIQHKKGAKDAKRGQAFSKLIKEISVVARDGGGSIDSNPRLRTLVDKAKTINMPQDNIQRAIKKGTGELPGVNYEEQIYEGYGPAGIAIIVDTLTDNKNRTVAEIRNIFNKGGGNMASSGSVSFMFQIKGSITISKDQGNEDDLFMLSTEAGAEDFSLEEEEYQVITEADALEKVKDEIEKAEIEIKTAERVKTASTLVDISSSDAARVLKLLDTLDDHEDVQNVWSNLNIPDDIISELD